MLAATSLFSGPTTSGSVVYFSVSSEVSLLASLRALTAVCSQYQICFQICSVVRFVNFSIEIMILNVVSLRLLTTVCSFLFVLAAGFKRLSVRYTLCSLFFSSHVSLSLWYSRYEKYNGLDRTFRWSCEPHICSPLEVSSSWVVEISPLSGRVLILDGHFTETSKLFILSLWQIEGKVIDNLLSPRLNLVLVGMYCLGYSLMEFVLLPIFPFVLKGFIAGERCWRFC